MVFGHMVYLKGYHLYNIEWLTHFVTDGIMDGVRFGSSLGTYSRCFQILVSLRYHTGFSSEFYIQG